jgi:hypothetical protein
VHQKNAGSQVKSFCRLRCAVAGVSAALLLLAVSPGAANATCASSVSNTGVIADTVGDAPGDGVTNAPDISLVDASLDEACNLTVSPVFDNRAALSAGDVVYIYLDTDNNSLTGPFGVDRELVISSDRMPELYAWNQAAFNYDLIAHVPVAGSAGFTATIDQLGLPGPTPIGVSVESVYFEPPPSDLSHSDYAPELVDPAFPFQVDFSQPPPPPPPPPQAPPPPPAMPATYEQKEQAGCVVPRVKRFSVAKAKRKLEKAGCRYRVRGKGRVRSTSPGAGLRTTRTVIVRGRQRARR